MMRRAVFFPALRLACCALQPGSEGDEKVWRGGANIWNPIFLIIAPVLDAALKFCQQDQKQNRFE